MQDLWKEEDDFQAEKRQDRVDEIMANNPDGQITEYYRMPDWLADKIADVEKENAARKAEENRKRMERYNAGLCEWESCRQPRMKNNAECEMHYKRGKYEDLR